MTKREIKRIYLCADIGLSDAIPALMDHDMDRGEAIRYLIELRNKNDKSRNDRNCD